MRTEDVVILVVSILGLSIILGILWYITRKAEPEEEKSKKNVPRINKAKQKEREKTGGLAGLRKRKGRNRRAEQVAEEEKEEEKEQERSDEEVKDEEEKEAPKLSRKEVLKEQKKKEREEYRRFTDAQREDKEKRRSAKDEAYKKKQKQREAEDKAKEEEQLRLKAEHEAKEAQEYDDWKSHFMVEEEGSKEEESSEESQARLQQFVEYIKAKKVVVLEELAAEFGLTSQDAINRIKSLLDMDIITGVIDDRGKFIYITQEELLAVASFINRKGRISIAELAAESNKLINLESREVESARVQEKKEEEANWDEHGGITTEARGREKGKSKE